MGVAPSSCFLVSWHVDGITQGIQDSLERRCAWLVAWDRFLSLCCAVMVASDLNTINNFRYHRTNHTVPWPGLGSAAQATPILSAIRGEPQPQPSPAQATPAATLLLAVPYSYLSQRNIGLAFVQETLLESTLEIPENTLYEPSPREKIPYRQRLREKFSGLNRKSAVEPSED
jgi:hypothetical protein